MNKLLLLLILVISISLGIYCLIKNRNDNFSEHFPYRFIVVKGHTDGLGAQLLPLIRGFAASRHYGIKFYFDGFHPKFGGHKDCDINAITQHFAFKSDAGCADIDMNLIKNVQLKEHDTHAASATTLVTGSGLDHGPINESVRNELRKMYWSTSKPYISPKLNFIPVIHIRRGDVSSTSYESRYVPCLHYINIIKKMKGLSRTGKVCIVSEGSYSKFNKLNNISDIHWFLNKPVLESYHLMVCSSHLVTSGTFSKSAYIFSKAVGYTWNMNSLLDY